MTRPEAKKFHETIYPGARSPGILTIHMKNAFSRVAALAALLLAVPLAASAAMKPFTGPAGWDHTVETNSPTSVLEIWRKGTTQSIAYLYNSAIVFDDNVATIKKNVADNSMKTTVDKTSTCAGKRAYTVGISMGPTYIEQLVIDEAPGVTKLTYSRPQSDSTPPEVTAALAAYCGS
jgi:hypothetical protein